MSAALRAILPALLLGALARCGLVAAEPGDRAGILRWHTGESLAGTLVSATATEVTWRSPLFEDPLRLRWEALRRADWAVERAAADEPFSVLLRDGSHLFAELVTVTDDTLTIRSARHGEAVLKRAEVLAARRIRGAHLIAAGPAGDARWRLVAPEMRKSASAPAAVPELRGARAGTLALPYWNRGAWLDVALPELVDVEFHLRSTRRPDFRLSLCAGGRTRLVVETWDEELVLRCGDAFQAIARIGEADREVALRLCWNRTTRKCAVFSPTGELLVEWLVPPDSNEAPPRLILQNKGRDLALEQLRVRPWDGTPPKKIGGLLPRLELVDGRTFEGRIAAGAAGTVGLAAEGTTLVAEHPLATVDALIFSTGEPLPPEARTTLTYADGTVLLGEVLEIRDGRARLATKFSDGTLTTTLTGLQQLLQPPPTREADRTADLRALITEKENARTDLRSRYPERHPQVLEVERELEALRGRLSGLDAQGSEALSAEWDTLILPALTMHGRMVATGEGAPRWLPIGGVEPVRPRLTAPLELRRALPPETVPPSAPALFYTHTGDVLPGTLRGLDRQTIEIDSPFLAPQKLPAASIDAIQFGGATAQRVESLADPAWQIVRGTPALVRRAAEKVTLEPGAALGHPSVLQAPEVKFSWSASSFGVLRVRLFCAGTESGKSPALLLAFMGNRVYSGLEGEEGQLDDQQETPTAGGQSLRVRLVTTEKQVELYLNEVLTRKFAVPPNRRFGTGLVLEPANIWGNTPRAVVLESFSAVSGPGRAWLPDVSAEARTQALTIPRFRQDRPPRQVLLGVNGDVLRGEIEAVTATHFAFRSGLEMLRVPRDRVRAAIRLRPPAEGVTVAVPPTPAQQALERKVSRNVRMQSELLSILATLQNEVRGVQLSYPTTRDSRRMLIDFGGQTLGELLDQVCQFYGLTYEALGDKIVIARRTALPEGLVPKVYWLQPAALPDGLDPQKLLTDKGVLFAKDATTQWRPATGQLTVTNLAAEQEKLAAILAADFGLAHDSPTHWLLLTSGARLGLTVSQFAPEAVIGHHPIYGACRVPLAHLLTVRTTPPEPTPAMKALADWQLIRAPEPVLPETGGESSPALGKAAPAFTLPRLGGGEWDLAALKGKVVVLDFWATWCGPCIKSLPPLIEAMSAFPSDQVEFIGVNQSEPAEQVQRFLETRGWKLNVALDAGQKVARHYGVEGIPHTVIVAPDGQVAWVKTGASADGAKEAAAAVQRLIIPVAR